MTIRYALYFAPPADSALWSFGSAVLGYDAASGADRPFPAHDALGEDWHALTDDPRRYGFHATLKAPFSLASGRKEAEVIAALDAFAAGYPGFDGPELVVANLGRFVALVPASADPRIHALETAVVEAFEPFRAPLTEADRLRRLKSPLTQRQITYLDRYGYPYVREEFRFHMTLSGSLPEARVEPVKGALTELYAPLAARLVVRDVSLFRQDSRDARFRIIHRAGLKPYPS